jgi:hypothetical protein
MASDSQTANDNDASGSCYICTKSISAKNTAVILCCACNNLCHASCLANGFVARYGGTKPAQQWLADFVREENLFHICKTCKDGGLRPAVGSSPSNTTGAPSNQVQQLNDVSAVTGQQDDVRKLRAEYVVLQTSVCTMAGTLDGIAKQLSELKNELSNSLCAGDPLSTQVNASDAPVSTVSTVTKPTIRTYSEVLSKDITKAVQTAVAQTLTTQRKDERISSSVVMYGLYENHRDWRRLHQSMTPHLSLLYQKTCQAGVRWLPPSSPRRGE